jgi:hypothetical protein
LTSADVDVVVVGAGPYGLSAAVHLQRAGLAPTVFGSPMSFWRQMPHGMKLRSNWGASSMVEPVGPLSLDAFRSESGLKFDQPVPLDMFVAYGDWVQERGVPQVDRRVVTRIAHDPAGFRIQLAGGDSLRAARVVVASGIAPFAHRPLIFDALGPDVVHHASEITDVSGFRGRRVAVVGGGQSALETAALVARAGGSVTVFVRSGRIVWLRGHSVKKRLGRLGPIVYAPTDVGPLWYSRLVERPGLFGLLPRRAQTRIAARCIRPAGSHWLREPLESVSLRIDRSIAGVSAADGGARLLLDDGTTHEAEDVILGTGYRVDIAHYPFLDPELVFGLRRSDGYPVLGRGFESSTAGLHFVGAPAAWSFGPTMRFVSGTWFTGRALAAHLRARSRTPEPRRTARAA